MNKRDYYESECEPEMRVLKHSPEPEPGNLSGTFEDTHKPGKQGHQISQI